MKIAWFTEAGFVTEKLSRDFKNMRTEYAWYVAQQAHHYPISMLSEESNLKNNSFDLGVIIIPKKIAAFAHIDIVNNWGIVFLHGYLISDGSIVSQNTQSGERLLYAERFVDNDMTVSSEIYAINPHDFPNIIKTALPDTVHIRSLKG